MKKKILLLAGLVFIIGSVFGQKNKGKAEQKFDKRLLCPFENGMGREPKEAFSWDPPDQKVIMISKTDTAIRSCIDAKVLKINATEDGRFEIVIYYKDWYFWYYGISKALVNVNQQIKAGQVLGLYTFGQEMEFRMFKDEEPMDPREFLECKIGEEKKNRTYTLTLSKFIKMVAYDTVSQAVNDLKQRGYTLDFNLKGSRLECQGQNFNPKEFEISEFHRFEGNSDPGDEAVVYAIESRNGLKGVLVNAFGIYSEPLSDEMIKKLSFQKN